MHVKLSIGNYKPSQSFAEAVSDLLDEVLINIPNESSVKCVIQQQHSNSNPSKLAYFLEYLKF